MKKRKLLLLIVIVIVITLLFGCSKKLTSGEVYDKNFTPAHSQVVLVPMVTSNGTISTTMWIPFYYYYSDDYSISIFAEVDGERKTATYHVSRDVYEACEVGSEFIYDKDLCSDSAAYTRERA